MLLLNHQYFCTCLICNPSLEMVNSLLPMSLAFHADSRGARQYFFFFDCFYGMTLDTFISCPRLVLVVTWLLPSFSRVGVVRIYCTWSFLFPSLNCEHLCSCPDIWIYPPCSSQQPFAFSYTRRSDTLFSDDWEAVWEWTTVWQKEAQAFSAVLEMLICLLTFHIGLSRFMSQSYFWFHLFMNARLGRQQVVSEMLESLPPVWET